MMILQVALALLGAAPEAPPQGQRFRYSSAVSFSDGKCRFWTGDVMMSADEYRRDLRERFDRKFGMVIYSRPDVPAKCAERARKLAIQAGFQDISLDTGAANLGVPN